MSTSTKCVLSVNISEKGGGVGVIKYTLELKRSNFAQRFEGMINFSKRANEETKHAMRLRVGDNTKTSLLLRRGMCLF